MLWLADALGSLIGGWWGLVQLRWNNMLLFKKELCNMRYCYMFRKTRRYNLTMLCKSEIWWRRRGGQHTTEIGWRNMSSQTSWSNAVRTWRQRWTQKMSISDIAPLNTRGKSVWPALLQMTPAALCWSWVATEGPQEETRIPGKGSLETVLRLIDWFINLFFVSYDSANKQKQ